MLALLAVAGLIRPEAWAFSGAYIIYLWFSGEHSPRQVAGWLAVAASGPLLWILGDLVLAGSALHSLSDTQENTRALGRATGISGLFTTAPRHPGEILREPVLFGAVGGLGFAIWLLRERVRTPILIGLVALAAFSLLAIAGLPINGRYLFAARRNWGDLLRRRRLWLARAQER